MATRKQLRAAYKLLETESGLKVGDKVRIIRKFSGNELGCLIDYNPDGMDECIGEEGTITYGDDDDGDGFIVDVPHLGEWTWPFFCLELLSSSTTVQLSGCDYDAVVNESGTLGSVGCQEIEADSVLELADRIRELQEAAASKIPKRPAKKATRRR